MGKVVRCTRARAQIGAQTGRKKAQDNLKTFFLLFPKSERRIFFLHQGASYVNKVPDLKYNCISPTEADVERIFSIAGSSLCIIFLYFVSSFVYEWVVWIRFWIDIISQRRRKIKCNECSIKKSSLFLQFIFFHSFYGDWNIFIAKFYLNSQFFYFFIFYFKNNFLYFLLHYRKYHASESSSYVW